MNDVLPKIVQVELLHCSKCDRYFYPKISNVTGMVIIPKYCAYHDCHSPNWNKGKYHYVIKNPSTRIISKLREKNPKKLTILEKFRLEKQKNKSLNSLELNQ